MSSDLKCLFTGDIVIKKDNFGICDRFKRILNENDIIGCNFEAPISSSSHSTPILKAGPHVLQHNKAAANVLEAGFNLISLANNHIYDYGEKPLRETLDEFQNVTTIGAGRNFQEAYELKIVEKKDKKLGFLSFAEWGFGAITSENQNCGGFAWINHHTVDILVFNSKKKVDVLIIQIHAGVEDVDLPLLEWRERYRSLVDLGADVIIGHHPHVPQGWETYNYGLIFYSLGNFYFDIDNPTGYWNHGYCVSLSIDDKNKIDFKVIPITKSIQGVDICEDQRFINHLTSLNQKLNGSTYPSLLEQQSLFLWEDRYKYYYLDSTNSMNLATSAKKFLRLLKRYFFNKRKLDYLLLLHNIKIESHRFAVENALSILNKV